MSRAEQPSPFCLETPRLRLRDFVPDDWPVIFALSRESCVTKFQSWLRLADEEAARQWVGEAIFHNGLLPRSAYNLAVTLKASGQVIGWLGWGKASRPERGELDFGYALLPAFWGRGYMSEALAAAVDYMFRKQQAGIVYGECDSINPASARVMEKAGLRLVAEWSDVDEESGESVAMLRYAASRDEFLAGSGASVRKADADG